MKLQDKPDGDIVAICEARGDVYIATNERAYRLIHGTREFAIVNFEKFVPEKD
jgi:hypothetical protein